MVNRLKGEGSLIESLVVLEKKFKLTENGPVVAVGEHRRSVRRGLRERHDKEPADCSRDAVCIRG